jgi:hypothetical protein
VNGQLPALSGPRSSYPGQLGAVEEGAPGRLSILFLGKRLGANKLGGATICLNKGVRVIRFVVKR